MPRPLELLLLALLVLLGELRVGRPSSHPFAAAVTASEAADAFLGVMMSQPALPNSMGSAISRRSSMNVSALIGSKDILDLWGYPYEQHEARTEDGYILTIDRIPNPGRPPVYMATPYLASAPVFLNLGRDYGLGFMLFDAGYDVWIGNVRGSIYSTGHVRLNLGDPEYWKFSFHENAIYDHTACIDVALAKTGYRQVLWAGYSLGTATFLIMASMRPDYARKVAAAFLMAPVTAQFHNPGIFMALAATNSTGRVSERLQGQPFPSALIRDFSLDNCRGEARRICNRGWNYISNSPRAEDYIGQTYFFLETFPTSGSYPTTFHLGQLSWAENVFRPYIFSKEKNLWLYGRAVPLNYPIEEITTPIFTYTGDKDVFSTPRDYRFLSRSVRSIVRRWRHPDPLFSHSDFVFSRRSLVLYRQIIKDMGELFT